MDLLRLFNVGFLVVLLFLAVDCSDSDDCLKSALTQKDPVKIDLGAACSASIPLESNSGDVVIVAKRPEEKCIEGLTPDKNRVSISIGDAACKLDIAWSDRTFDPTRDLTFGTKRDVRLMFGSSSVTVKYDMAGKTMDGTVPASCGNIWKEEAEGKYTTTLTIERPDNHPKCDHIYLSFPDGVKHVEQKAEVERAESGSSMSFSIIAGIVAAVVGIVFLAGIVIFCLCDKKKEKGISAADMPMRRKKKKGKRSKKGKHGKHKKEKKPKKFNPYENPFEIKSKSEVTASKSTVDCTTEGKSAVSGATTSRA